MNENEQLGLIKEFMLAVAPEVVRHQFTQLRHHQITLALSEEGLLEHSALAIENAQITLELAMHLAARYAKLSEEIAAKETKPEASQPASHLREAG